MYHLIIYIICAVFAALSVLFLVTLLKDVQRQVARWLRENGLANSALMDAVVFLDRVGTRIRASVKVVTRSRRTEILMLERTYSIEQIKDAQLRAALEQRGRAQQNVMTLFNTA